MRRLSIKIWMFEQKKARNERRGRAREKRFSILLKFPSDRWIYPRQ